MAFYPTIRDEVIMSLNAVVLNMEKDTGYLDSNECPYSEQVKSFFRKKIASEGGGSKGSIDLFQIGEGETDLDKLTEQIMAVINDLEEFGRKLTIADSPDKMGYFRTKTALIEKLVNMRERVFSIKEINEFKSTILSFMDEVLTKDQITEFMRRLDGIMGTKNDNIQQ